MAGVWYTAKELFEGHNDTWQQKTYFVLFPFQMAPVLFFEGMFRLLHTSSFQAAAVVHSVCVAACVYCGYQITQQCFENRYCSGCYLILALCYLPPVLLAPMLYGDIPSTTCIFIALLWCIQFIKTGRWRYLFGLVPALLVGNLARNIGTIAVIAVLLVLFCSFSGRRPDWRRLVAASGVMGCILLICLQMVPIINRYLRFRTGESMTQGIPFISWVVMGMQDGERGPGAFNEWTNNNFYAADRDPELAQKTAEKQLKLQIQEFTDHPAKALDFYHRKLMYEWADPTFASLSTGYYYITNDDGSIDGSAFANAMYQGALGQVVQAFMGGYQLLVYLAAFGGCIWLFRQPRAKLYMAAPLVVFLGGFFFFLMWEAQSRYVFPFFMMLIPLAAVGLWQGGEGIKEVSKRIWRLK